MNPKNCFNGCNRKCPCRIWIQCNYYIDEKKKQSRIKDKIYDYETWYKDNFRCTVGMYEVVCTL